MSTLCKTVESISEFSKETVKILDQHNVDSKLECIFKGGPDKIQVIMDFDATITRYSLNGKRCPSTHRVIEDGCFIAEPIKRKLNELFEKYYPIEIDGVLSIEEKTPHMIKWYKEAHESLAKCDIKRDDVKSAVKSSNAQLREKCQEVFKVLNELGIPLLIFSAGLGDVVEEVLHYFECFHPNMKVISNFMDFDKNETLCGFKDETIHVFNKNETVLGNHSDYFEKLKGKDNIILLGDSLGDLDMCNGHKNLGTVLKIGFLNCKFEENMDQYLRGYDVVLVADETMELLSGIIAKLQ